MFILKIIFSRPFFLFDLVFLFCFLMSRCVFLKIQNMNVSFSPTTEIEIKQENKIPKSSSSTQENDLKNKTENEPKKKRKNTQLSLPPAQGGAGPVLLASPEPRGHYNKNRIFS